MPPAARLLLRGLAAAAAPNAAPSAPAFAAPSQPADGRAGSAALARLFARTCLPHAGDPRRLRDSLAGPPYRREPDDAAASLLGRPGQAYRVPGETGHLMVLSFDDGWCGNGGTGIDPHALTLLLSRAMRARGIAMRLMGAGTDGREQRYLLLPAAPAAPIVLLVLLLPSGHSEQDMLMQASLFAAPMPPDPDPPR